MTILDLRTLLLVLVLVSFGCAALCVVLSRVSNRRGSLSALAWAECLLGAGFALVAVRGASPDVLTYIVANLLIVAGYGGHWLSLRRLTGQIFPWGWALPVLAAVAGLQIWLTYLLPSLPGRIILISLVCAGIAGLIVWDAIRCRTVTRMLIVPHAVFAAMMLSRVWLAVTMPDPATQPFLSSGPVQQGYFLGILLAQLWMAQAMLWSIGMDWYREVAGAVAARDQAEQSRRITDSRLSGLMALDAACIVFLDPETRVVEASPSFCRLLGVGSSRDLAGETLLPYTVEEDRERVALLHRALTEGQIGSYRVRKTLRTAQDAVVRVDMTVGPLSGKILPGDRAKGFVAFCQPLTENVMTEA